MRQPFVRDGQLDRESVVGELRRFLDLAVREMHLELRYEIAMQKLGENESEGTEVSVDFSGPDQDLLLSRNAELMVALEYIAKRWLRLDPHWHDHIRFDCGGYCGLRAEELKLSARVAAQRVRETHQPFRFQPMPPRDRRIIHLELTSAPSVRSVSEGMGEHRYVVIRPDESKK